MCIPITVLTTSVDFFELEHLFNIVFGQLNIYILLLLEYNIDKKRKMCRVRSILEQFLNNLVINVKRIIFKRYKNQYWSIVGQLELQSVAYDTINRSHGSLKVMIFQIFSY